MVATVEMDRCRMLELEGIEAEQHLYRPWPSVHEVPVEKDWILRAGLARNLLNHVDEVEVLTMQVTDDCNLRAWWNCYSLKALLLLQDVHDIKCHHVGILHGQLALLLVEGEQVINERIIH